MTTKIKDLFRHNVARICELLFWPCPQLGQGLKRSWAGSRISVVLRCVAGLRQDGRDSGVIAYPRNVLQNGAIATFCKTSGIYEVFLKRSGRKIWVRGEPSPEPYIPCYTPRRLKGGERSVA